jgi:hypothetical protein
MELLSSSVSTAPASQARLCPASTPWCMAGAVEDSSSQPAACIATPRSAGRQHKRRSPSASCGEPRCATKQPCCCTKLPSACRDPGIAMPALACITCDQNQGGGAPKICSSAAALFEGSRRLRTALPPALRPVPVPLDALGGPVRQAAPPVPQTTATRDPPTCAKLCRLGPARPAARQWRPACTHLHALHPPRCARSPPATDGSSRRLPVRALVVSVTSLAPSTHWMGAVALSAPCAQRVARTWGAGSVCPKTSV